MFKIIIWSIILTVIVRFIFRFLLPVFHITSTVQDRVRQMQQQMDQMQQQTNNTNTQAKPKKQVEGDYIDYEEVK